MLWTFLVEMCKEKQQLLLFIRQWMVVILPGDLTAIVPNPVEVEYKPGLELAPIHHQHMVEVIAVNWGQISLPENAITRTVQV